MSTTAIPQTQFAVQLVGPNQLRLNPAKEVFRPGPHQVLARIECVGLCFSDLKLLKQFDQHARKSEVVTGLAPEVLKEIPSYVPCGAPTVPGHEVTCRIVAIGDQVKHHKVGERVLVQTDYRDLPTKSANAAFGYNFEGALQEYVLMDERVIIDHTGERFLIPVSEELSASAIALVEPWACVEDSYANVERRTIKPGGKLLVVAEAGHEVLGLDEVFAKQKPGSIVTVTATDEQGEAVTAPFRHLGARVPQIQGVLAGAFTDLVRRAKEVTPNPSEEQRRLFDELGPDMSPIAALDNEEYDDIIYFGARKAMLDILNDKLATRGILNVVLGGQKIGAPVSVGIGRVHYGQTRWIGTTGSSAAESYTHIPPTGEIRPGETIAVIGAGGPMGQMHVIRSICAGVPGVTVTGTDMDDARLAALLRKAQPLADANRVGLRMVNTQKTPLTEKFSYLALMAPVGVLVANAVRDAADGAIINIFAGIPSPTKQDLDLDTYIARRAYLLGTSGSVIRDMKIVLAKVTAGQLDTNLSVDAVSGIAGAVAGIAAVENRTLAGKILVYPMLHDLGLVPLTELPARFPTVAAKLDDGKWTKAAEDELLRVGRGV